MSLQPVWRVVLADFGTMPALWIASTFAVLVVILVATNSWRKNGYVEALMQYIRFCYGCFIKPHKKGSRDQKDALESFYKTQASIYDTTRARLLKGREDLLGLVAAQVQWRIKSGAITGKPIWVDVGGGTGYNIEQMSQYVDVPAFFEKVFLVDLSPSLTAVAIDRFRRLGWKNVEVICQDARHFRLDNYYSNLRRPDVITLSYSLSMIPEFYSVVDSLASNLAENGIIGVADFYVQNEVDFHARNYTGGDFNRHCMWISRVFWRTWFEVDRVNLEAARRDYLEYRFGTVLSFNARCRLLGFRIPYYVWIGCCKSDTPSLDQLDAKATESPLVSAQDSNVVVRSKAYESATKNLAASVPLPASWYQSHHWRLYYDDVLQKHRQFGDEYIYAFTWEDVREDLDILKITSDDVIMAITSAGDNLLAYALEGPKRIHAVDLNPNQNHLLELKVAAFTALGHADLWALFGQGSHSAFRQLLIRRLSPHLSSLAFQYWLHHGPEAFDENGRGLYSTGGSRHALTLVRWLARIFGLQQTIEQLCSTKTLAEQRQIWKEKLRPILLSRLLSRVILSNKIWLWRALGVPQPQREMIELDHAASVDGTQGKTNATSKPNGGAIWTYCVQTLDPVAMATHLRTSNHYYLLTLLGHYSQECHPEYLSARAHRILSKSNAFDGLRIHTDEVREVLSRLQPGTLTIAVVMDSLDWFDSSRRSGRDDAAEQVHLMYQSLTEGGRVLLRSAGTMPWYMKVFEERGFDVRRIAVREGAKAMDRVNMYASTWICTKRPRTPRQARPLDPLVLDSLSGTSPTLRPGSAGRSSLRHPEPFTIGKPALALE